MAESLLLLFNRPTEPCFMQKRGKVLELPDNFYPDRYKNYCSTLTNRFGEGAETTYTVRNITIPDLSIPLELPYEEQFSLLIPKHRKMAGRLIDIFMEMRDIHDLISVCAYCQLRINPYMFNYCLSVAMLHKDFTKGLNIPNFVESFPDKFMDPKVISRARAISSTTKNLNPASSRPTIIIPQNYTAADFEPEQRVAYFREDIGVNLHHWHWHLVYPSEANDPALVKKDRRGELFYYMHQQMVARYSTERLCNGLSRPRRYNDFRSPIEEGYFPKLDSQVSSRTWPPRFAGSIIQDLDRPVEQIKIEVSQLEVWRDRFLQAIENMAIILPDGSKKPLDEETGIDILGDVMESSVISPNRGYYGDFHNMGHVFFSYTHDPDNKNLERHGVMGDLATSMRDPIFYRWHSYIDDMFQFYKHKIPPYSRENLEFPGIRVDSISIGGFTGTNRLTTFWQQSKVELTSGLDFTADVPIFAQFTHLQHNDFTYNIKVNNSSTSELTGTVRIFMAPKLDENGNEFAFEDQRRLMIELDKFKNSFPVGTSTVTRNSLDSSVTVPFERTFRKQNTRPGKPDSAESAEFNFCICGWPHYMLIPKGTVKGYPVELFCMISDWTIDRVDQNLGGTCSDADSYCGIRDRKYPDRRAMGYPFDRPAPVNSLADFITPNMAIQQCTINFSNRVDETL